MTADVLQFPAPFTPRVRIALEMHLFSLIGATTRILCYFSTAEQHLTTCAEGLSLKDSASVEFTRWFSVASTTKRVRTESAWAYICTYRVTVFTSPIMWGKAYSAPSTSTRLISTVSVPAVRAIHSPHSLD